MRAYEAPARRSFAPRPLENITTMLYRLGNPDRAFRSVQGAGTNGKGSTCAFIEAILRSGGLTVGLFTSPALIDMPERIRVNNEPIRESELFSLCEDALAVSKAYEQLSGFDLMTLCAALYFKRRRVDAAVFECGLGGRLDPTTALKRSVTVITRVSLDHTEVLGESLEAIAKEKAAVLKPLVPAVIAAQERVVEDVILRKAQDVGAPVFALNQDCAGLISSDVSKQTFSLSVSDYLYDSLKISLIGAHQLENAAAAVQAVQVFYPSPESVVKEGLASARWACRMEHFPANDKRPGVIIDGAHNPGAASALASAITALLPSKPAMLFAAMPHKDARSMLEQLLPAVSYVTLTQFEGSIPVDELAKICLGLSMECSAEPLESALDAAIRRCANDSYLIVTGSLYFAGLIREKLTR